MGHYTITHYYNNTHFTVFIIIIFIAVQIMAKIINDGENVVAKLNLSADKSI